MYRGAVVGMALAFTACSFDTRGIPTGTDGSTSPQPDGAAFADGMIAPSDAAIVDACVASCTGDQLHECDPAPATRTCSLGCRPTGDACRTIVPSNGADDTQLAGVTQPLVFGPGESAIIDSDTGQIVSGELIVRGPGGGVVDGIRYQQLPGNIAVLGMTALSVGQDAYVKVVGGRALILLSAGDAIINGAIDVSAGCANGGVTCPGPGGGAGTPDEAIAAVGCAPGQNGGGATGLPPETGGGGGSFGGAGATGGNDGDDLGGAAGSLPGSCPGPTLVPLMGGSGGGSGGIDDCGGDGGGGGGALQISSYTHIELVGPSGTGRPIGLRASGAGGRGGENSDGGGGGGAGGGILLEAPTITVADAVLAANGGAGGGGGNNPAGATGEPGRFGSGQAVGGDDDRQGGLGGSVEGAPTAGEGGGDNTGGGGGGVGIIRLNVPAAGLTLGSNVVISPAHSRGDPATN